MEVYMLEIFSSVTQSLIMAIFYLIIIILGIFAGKKFREYKNAQKADKNK